MTTALIDVREVRATEVGRAGEVTAAAYREYVDGPGWERYLQRIGDVAARASRALVLVATVEGAIAGTATLELQQRIDPDSTHGPLAPDEAHLRMLGVAPEHRGSGVGRRLVEGCIAAARAQDKQRITLDTTEEMVAAIAMYTSMGFRFTGTSERNPGMCLLTYELRLGQR